jgi:hypothetical protein
MANKALTLNSERQYPLVAMQEFTYENIADANVAVPILKLPRGARVLRGQLITSTGFTATSTIKIGTAASDARYGTIDATAAGVDNLTIPNDTVEATTIYAKPSIAMLAGAALLVVEYVIPGRGNEVQP